MSRVLLALIAGYKRAISPILPAGCRYQPTCSDYMAEAIRVHGPARGLWMGIKRIGRCRPGGGEGYDPVPPKP
jgi:putative membrane protein insertion efficiency factor